LVDVGFRCFDDGPTPRQACDAVPTVALGATAALGGSAALHVRPAAGDAGDESAGRGLVQWLAERPLT